MSIFKEKKFNKNTSRMASRKIYRWIVICVVIAVFVYLHGGLSSLWVKPPTITVAKSSFDWSTQWKPFHPIKSMQPLPSEKPHKLRKIQHHDLSKKPPRFDIAVQTQRQEFVKKTLVKSWNSYKEFAWMHDEFTPVSGGWKDTFGGWAATAVDALDTLWIMGMRKEFHEAVDAIGQIDWAKTNSTSCIVFETTIRHLGGLLAAYDLSKESILLEKAIELGDMLYAAFDTPNHMPPFWLDYERAKTGYLLADDYQAAATATSLSLEFTRLAQLTKNNKYYDAIARITDKLYETQHDTKIPGLWPTHFDLRHGIFTADNSFTLGGMSDSMYEYILKMQLILAGTEPKYEKMYRVMTESIIKHLLFRPMTPDKLDILFSGTARQDPIGLEVELTPEGQHLACFAGGMFAIGGKLYNISEHIDIGARLTKGCIWAYDAFPTGIMPEIFGLASCNSTKKCAWNGKQWKDSAVKDAFYSYPPKGFLYIQDSRYILRPEALESVFILYRVTGEEVYREAAWRMFQNIVRFTDTEYGNSAISNVRSDKPTKLDSQESFWLAETLKYAFLTFSPPDVISLDDYVLNTEAHPLRIPKS